MRRAASLLALMIMAAAACDEPTQAGLPSQCEATKQIPVGLNRNLDMLFVIDSSPAMAEEQARFETNAPRFIDVMETVAGGLPAIQLGVITSDLGAGAAIVPGCTGAGDGGIMRGGFLRDLPLPDGTRERNYTGTLRDAFTDRALGGASGCRFSQPFGAVRRALDGSNPENAGFLRDEAYLFVAFITAQDDCTALSPDLFASGDTFTCTSEGITCGATGCEPAHQSRLVEDPGRFVDFLTGLKDDDQKIMVSGVFGDPEPIASEGGVLQPSCGMAGGVSAQPGVRLDWTLGRFPNRHTFTSMCNEDWATALEIFVALLKTTLGNPCLDGNIDTTDIDPVAPGLQLECSVTDVRDLGTDRETHTVLPRCDLAADGTLLPTNGWPCWWAEIDPQSCSATESNVLPRVERANYFPPGGTTTVIRCALADCP